MLLQGTQPLEMTYSAEHLPLGGLSPGSAGDFIVIPVIHRLEPN
jgi:hypothetical protein